MLLSYEKEELMLEPKIKSDEELMVECKRDDDFAFETLFDRYKKPLLNFVYKYVKDKNKCEDIFQQTFLKVYTKRKSFKGKSSFKTWLYTIAKNLVTDNYRKEQTRKRIKAGSVNNWGEEENLVFEIIESDSEDPLSNLEYKEFQTILQREINGLPSELKDPFILVRYQGLSYSETADVFGCSISTIKMRMHRALQKLSLGLSNYLNRTLVK